MTARQNKKDKGHCLLLSVSPFVSLVTVILCVAYTLWLQNATSHINELGKRRMLTRRNLETVLEYAIFNKSSHRYAFIDEYVASPENTEYTRNVDTFFVLLEELINKLDQQFGQESEFENLYFRTARAADAVVQSINQELDSNASATLISAAIFLTVICAAIVIVATSLNVLILTRRLLRKVQDNLTAHNKRLDTLPIMVYEFSMENGNSTFDYTSKAAQKIFGADISAAQVAIDMIHESERAGFIDSMNVSSEQLTPWTWKGPITNALGEEKVISFQSVPERISATRVTWTGAIQDITNLHVALQTMERRLEFVPVFELVVHGDGSTKVHYITTVAADILGHKQKKTGFDILDYIVEADRECVFKTLTNPAPGKKWLQEFTTVAGIRVRGCANSHLNNRGETVWTGVLEDVGMQHDLMRVRRERDMQKTVAEQLKTRCNFLAHEVRNTLFPHNMMLEDMKERYPDSQENVELILAGYRTVGDVLDRALMIAKYEAGEMTTKSIRFNLVALCKSLKAYAAAAVARNANQHVEVVDDLPDGEDTGALWVVGDRQVCEQATTNLLSNAVKYGGGKPFKIRLSHDGEVFTFTVTDNGRGMTEEGLKTACVPFGTIRTGNDQTKGTGLGLPLTHAMIMNAGGSLTLQSEGLGHGTVATIRLPLSRSTDSGQKGINKQEGCEELPAWVNECKNSPLPCRVLLVDDSPLVLKMMQHLCRKVGIEYDSATNGETALKLMTQQHKQYSLVLMDRSMPGLQGDVVCQRARATGYKGVVVLLTGDQVPDPTSMIQQFGLSGVLCKSGQQPSVQTILKHIST